MKRQDHPGYARRALAVGILAVVVLASWLWALSPPRDDRAGPCGPAMVPAAAAGILLAAAGWLPPDRRIDIVLVSLPALDPPPRPSIAG